MIFAIATLLIKLTGWNFDRARKWASLILVGLFVLVVLIAYFGVKSCLSKRRLKIEQERIEKINKGNEKEKKKEIQDLVEENSDVVETVERDRSISETNTFERIEKIDEKVAEVNKKINDLHKQGKDVTQEELECLLVPSHCQ